MFHYLKTKSREILATDIVLLSGSLMMLSGICLIQKVAIDLQKEEISALKSSKY